jgi:GTP-binding protein
MDSGDIERERGITIMSKVTRVDYDDCVFNIVDTPGHQDFGGEVERVLSMVDGVILVVDATEGAMSQTKFVLAKALAAGAKPIVVYNKADRPAHRLSDGEVQNEVFDLFVNLDATDDQLDFPQFYASAKEGWAVAEVEDIEDPEKRKAGQGMGLILDSIKAELPCPVTPERPFAMAVTMIGSDPFVGKLLTGRIHSGTAKVGTPVKCYKLPAPDSGISAAEVTSRISGRVSKIYSVRGSADREDMDVAEAGDIVTIAGIDGYVTDTIAAADWEFGAIEVPLLDPSTISMSFAVNDSGLKSEGKFLTSGMIQDRLKKETETNVAITISDPNKDGEDAGAALRLRGQKKGQTLQGQGAGEASEVNGRGELQLAVLAEEMRREGYEFCIAAPKVIMRKDPETDKVMEPVEETVVDVDESYAGTVIEKIALRKGNLIEYKAAVAERVRLVFMLPSRGMIGLRNELATDTSGSAIVNSIFHSYAVYEEAVGDKTERGKLISSEEGKATAYSLNMIEERGELFIGPGQECYVGMVIGEHSRNNDLDVNPTKGKKATNIRTQNTDENVQLRPPRQLSLEQMIAYIDSDEMIEVTPTQLRMRKRVLNATLRKRFKASKMS